MLITFYRMDDNLYDLYVENYFKKGSIIINDNNDNKNDKYDKTIDK